MPAKRNSKKVAASPANSTRKRNRDTTSDVTINWEGGSKMPETDSPRIGTVDFGGEQADSSVKKFIFTHSHGDAEAGVVYDHVLFVRATAPVPGSEPAVEASKGKKTPAKKGRGSTKKGTSTKKVTIAENPAEEGGEETAAEGEGVATTTTNNDGTQDTTTAPSPAKVPLPSEVEGYVQIDIPNGVEGEITATIDHANRTVSLSYEVEVSREVEVQPPAIEPEAPTPVDTAVVEEDDGLPAPPPMDTPSERPPAPPQPIMQTVTTTETQELVQKWNEFSALSLVEPNSCEIGFEIFSRKAKISIA